MQKEFYTVAVGVVLNAAGKILIAKRPQDVHLGGFWEFPGGKVEAHEAPEQALARELYEETDLQVQAAEDLGVFHHEYECRRVNFHVYKVTAFEGMAKPKASQAIRWVSLSDLSRYQFPQANVEIIAKLRNSVV